MNPIFAAALELQQFCNQRTWSFCFIGGVAVQRWGEPRLGAGLERSLETSKVLFGDEGATARG